MKILWHSNGWPPEWQFTSYLATRCASERDWLAGCQCAVDGRHGLALRLGDAADQGQVS